MLGINGWEALILIVLGVVVLGPERLPEYAAKLAHGVRRLRVMAEGAKVTLKDQLGPEYQDINWRQYDPRQYDPRRIVREALAEPLDYVSQPFREVADALQIAGDADGGDAFSQVDGERLPARDGEDGVVLDPALQGVEPGVHRDDMAGEIGVERAQRLHGVGQHLFGNAAHFRDALAERAEFAVVSLDDVIRHRYLLSLPFSRSGR